ncbi:MAG TPA: hypothetical protein VFM49_25630 [Chloroflexia bacterium]|jgi:hypothetical protein|nr:hypothetical protein [Chloroflexia bacterium]
MIRLSSSERTRTLRSVALLITAVGWNAFILYMLYTAVRDGVLVSWVGLSLLPLLIAGVVLFHYALGVAGAALYAALRLGQPQVEISAADLPGGAEFAFTYRRDFRRAGTLHGLCTRLVREEVLRAPNGLRTNTVVREEEIAAYQRRAEQYRAGETLVEHRVLAVPPTGRPTLRDRAVAIVWFIEVQLDLGDGPLPAERFEITVLPPGQALAPQPTRADLAHPEPEHEAPRTRPV